jgi:hypothetical protein
VFRAHDTNLNRRLELVASIKPSNAWSFGNRHTCRPTMGSDDSVSSVGGVASGDIARAGNGLDGRIGLRYNAEAPDGQRLEVTVCDRTLRADLPDWLLVPIARFAASPYRFVCVAVRAADDRKAVRHRLSRGFPQHIARPAAPAGRQTRSPLTVLLALHLDCVLVPLAPGLRRWLTPASGSPQLRPQEFVDARAAAGQTTGDA